MWFTSRSHRRKVARPSRFVPRLESLEDRTVPTTLGPLIDLSDPDVFAAFGSNGAEKETYIVVNPTNPNNIVATWWGGLGKGIVTAVNDLDLKDSKNVEMVDRATPTYGRNDTLLRQLFGDVAHPSVAGQRTKNPGGE